MSDDEISRLEKYTKNREEILKKCRYLITIISSNNKLEERRKLQLTKPNKAI
jgi:hypothetical protein